MTTNFSVSETTAHQLQTNLLLSHYFRNSGNISKSQYISFPMDLSNITSEYSKNVVIYNSKSKSVTVKTGRYSQNIKFNGPNLNYCNCKTPIKLGDYVRIFIRSKICGRLMIGFTDSLLYDERTDYVLFNERISNNASLDTFFGKSVCFL